jgi:GntR family transcriptional regulator
MDTLDRSTPVPLHFQLREILLERIERAQWKPGELIPSEQELQETYHVSRTTVRQTLSKLVSEGYLSRQRGRGTFVAEVSPTTEKVPDETLPDDDTAQSAADATGWRVVGEGWCNPADIQNQTQFALVDRLYWIMRLRVENHEPIGYHVAYVPGALAEQLDPLTLTGDETLDYLTPLPELGGNKAHYTVEARTAGPMEIDLLGIDDGAPILQIERVVLNSKGETMEFSQARYRGDRFKYHSDGNA